jgi:hypothetical protein
MIHSILIPKRNRDGNGIAVEIFNLQARIRRLRKRRRHVIRQSHDSGNAVSLFLKHLGMQLIQIQDRQSDEKYQREGFCFHLRCYYEFNKWQFTAI